MDKIIKDFILLAGYRRYNAVKKLGWKTIPTFIKSENMLIDIKLSDLELGENARINESSEELTELMQSIKQNGLLEPVVAVRTKELSEEDFIALNLNENIHRKNLSPLEISLRIKRLKTLGLNEEEIAVRLNMNKTRVSSLSQMSRIFNEKDLEKLSFSDENLGTKGKVAYTIAKKISTASIKNSDKQLLLDKAKKENLKNWDLEVITALIVSGMSTRQAIKEFNKYEVITPHFVLNTKIADKLKEQYKCKTYGGILKLIVLGKIPVWNEGLLYINDYKSLYLEE